MGVKFVSVKASSPQIRRTHVPNLGRWIIYKESTKNSYKTQKKYKYKGYKLRTKQCLSLTGSQTKSSSIPTQSVCAHLKHSHIVSSLLHCGLQRNDQYRTHNQHLVPHLLPSNCQRQEQLGQCPNLMECQTELDPGKTFSSVFLKDQKEHSTQANWFWI